MKEFTNQLQYNICKIMINIIFLSVIIIGSNASPLINHQLEKSELNGSSWDYTLKISVEDVPIGVVVNLPTGYTFLSSNIPDIQVREINTRILFSLPNGGDLIYKISGSAKEKSLLSGSFTNIINGETLPLTSLLLCNGKSELQKNDHVVTHQQDNDVVKSPGFDLFLPIIVLVSIAGYYIRREKL